MSGNCVAAGVAGNSSFRCFAQPSAGIYDPCFAAPSATSGPLVCPSADPADTDVTRFDVGQLPSPLSGAPEVRPWAILLPDGQTCTMVNAAWGGLGPFGCQSSSTGALADCHVPVQGDPWWTAMCQSREDSSSPFVSYRLDKVWT